MKIKRFNYSYYNRYQKRLTKSILLQKTKKRKIKEIVFLFSSIVFLWIPFSISVAMSNMTIKTKIKYLWKKANFIEKNFKDKFFQKEDNNPKKATIDQKKPKKHNYTKSLMLKKRQKATIGTFVVENNNNNAKKYIESTDDSDSFIKLSDIAEFTNEDGQIINKNMENPFWQKEEDLKKITFEYSLHKIEKNESLWLIAKRYGISIESLITANHLEKEKIHALKVNEKLKIPHFSGIYYKIKPRDTLLGLSQKYNVSLKEIRKYNKIPNYLTLDKTIFLPKATFKKKNKENLFGSIFSTPVKNGNITSHYGIRFHPIKKKNLFHTGIDIGKKENEKAFSIANGKVIEVGIKKNYGKYIIIKHRYGYTSLYAHLSKVYVKKNQTIKRAVRIGAVGSTGLSTGPHLHFELKKNDKLINPERFFNLKDSIEKKTKYVKN